MKCFAKMWILGESKIITMCRVGENHKEMMTNFHEDFKVKSQTYVETWEIEFRIGKMREKVKWTCLPIPYVRCYSVPWCVYVYIHLH